MNGIQIIIVIAVNIVKAELDSHQLNKENTSSAEASLKSSIGYEYIEHKEIDNENKIRIVSSHHVTESGEGDHSNQKGKFTEDITTKDTFKNKQEGELFDLDIAVTNFISRDVLLDTKGRSVIRELNEKDFKTVGVDRKTISDPIHNHRRRCGAAKIAINHSCYSSFSESGTDYDSDEYYTTDGDYTDDSSSGSYERWALKSRPEDGVIDNEIINRYITELKAGNPADLFGTNQHYSQPDVYKDFSRRFVQYPYTEVKHKTNEKDRLTPKLAAPEVVLEIAKKSAVLEATKPLKNSNSNLQKEILRTGYYWNDFWKEDVNPENILRTQENKKQLETMNIKIMPGSSLYKVVMMLKSKSPRLLYIINNKQKAK